MSYFNKVYQVGEWIYYASEFYNIYRINVDGSDVKLLYTANLGFARGSGVHSLTQCGNCLVFTQGSYIYKMNLTTLETEVLLSANDENTYFALTAKDDAVYFMGTEADFSDGIYKIDISGGQPVKLYDEGKNNSFNRIQIVDDHIFYSIQLEGVYQINLDGSDKKRIIRLDKINSWGDFIVSDGYIYFLKNDYTLQRSDMEGKKSTQISDSCYRFIMMDGWILYSKLAVEDNFHYGMNIYKMRTDKTGFEQILEGGAELYGSSGNWIYFQELDASVTHHGTATHRIRFDGTGFMTISQMTDSETDDEYR